MTAPAATTDNAVWSSLPVPAILIDDGDRIVDVNPAAEGFLNSSAKALGGSRSGTGSPSTRRWKKASGAPGRREPRCSSMMSTSAPATARRFSATYRSRRCKTPPAA